MGLILDTSILIAGERRGEGVEDILHKARSLQGDVDLVFSSVAVVELTHGIYRARTDSDRAKRVDCAESVFQDLIVHPLSFTIAQLAGQIEGEQAGQGNTIAFEDLVIGATALHLGFGVATLKPATLREDSGPQDRCVSTSSDCHHVGRIAPNPAAL